MNEKDRAVLSAPVFSILVKEKMKIFFFGFFFFLFLYPSVMLIAGDYISGMYLQNQYKRILTPAQVERVSPYVYFTPCIDVLRAFTGSDKIVKRICFLGKFKGELPPSVFTFRNFTDFKQFFTDLFGSRSVIAHVNAVANLIMFVSALLGFSGVIFFFLYLKIVIKTGKKAFQGEVKRGSVAVEPKKLWKIVKKKYGGGKVRLTKHLFLPEKLENRHVFIVGTSGSGKTTIIKNLMLGFRERENTHLVVVDFKGDYIENFFDEERDILLNPLDSRCFKWDMFRDFEVFEARDFAGNFVNVNSVRNDTERFFTQAARDVLSDVLEVLKSQGGVDYKELYSLFRTQKSLFDFLSEFDCPSKEQMGAFGSGQASGVMGSLTQKIDFLRLMIGIKREQGLKEWFTNNTNGSVFLFLPPDRVDTLSSFAGGIIEILAKYVLGKQQTETKVLFILDELGNLPKIESLSTLLDAGRSKNVGVVVGTQDLGKIWKKYGKEETTTLINNSAVWCVLRVNEPQTAEYFSSALGEAEIKELTLAYHGGSNSAQNLYEQHRKVATFLKDEIQNLPDLKAILKFASLPPSKFDDVLIPKGLKAVVSPFIARELPVIRVESKSSDPNKRERGKTTESEEKSGHSAEKLKKMFKEINQRDEIEVRDLFD